MVNKLEKKLEEFVAIRKYAETKQRKELIDQEVRVYLSRKCTEVKDWQNAYHHYQELYLGLNEK